MSKLSLEAETIDGHFVSESIKKIWKTELNIYKEFKKICDKHGLKYVAAGGTLLGVIRHNGSFIPWDDDMDIMMPYNDYCRFKEIAASELPDELFLQSYETEKGFYSLLFKIRDSRTTMYTKFHAIHEDWNKGAWIDIFPLCNVNDNKIIEEMHRFTIKIARLPYYGCEILNRSSKKKSKKNRISRLFVINLYKFLSLFFSDKTIISFPEKVASCFNKRNTKRLANYANLYVAKGKYTRLTFEREWCENLMNHKFYDTEIPIPVNYDAALKEQYGNWRLFDKESVGHKTHYE